MQAGTLSVLRMYYIVTGIQQHISKTAEVDLPGFLEYVITV